ncbi:toxin [Candidatus Kuenenbacteria bacterium CG_4_9_14_3_um_filter_39_14]|uniref:Toxin n=3 Tax=Candidatus Kueneniibacteriota TaxID=1752740 RepID=A0A2M7MH14_9BACT|nr:MAG: toxin [Candidatus Kuenenbacteria bacterium CG22_combo_CG10-13_8_21_14_all_39_9]PIX92388.1 MAG: toxin [Candidatus Kuenenbacteria bacterium CG_4_10_14_3_um_filter_39_14]PJA92166.1 MAG: toxin [Candidatus Kuenenbacteria bacterium CG_4_9_14_3_um_filter_39_14]
MKYFDWNSQKNEKLRAERDIGFEDCLLAIEEGKILDILEHKNKKKYPNQKIFVLEISGYAYLAPFVEDKDKVFLKTIIPSRKATKEYLLKIKNK